jgi:hypothetical protein
MKEMIGKMEDLSKSLHTEIKDLKTMHLENQARISALEQENRWLKYVFKTEVAHARRPRVKLIEKNVMLFPLRHAGSRDIPQEFQDAVKDDKIHQTLGVTTEECEVIDRGENSAWVRVHMKTMARKRQVLKYPTRNAVRQAHRIVLKEELLLEEGAERTHLKPAMDVLYRNNFHPFWDRGNIAWWKEDKFVSMSVFDVPVGMEEGNILAKANSLSAEAPPARQRAMDTSVETITAHGVAPTQVVRSYATATSAQA